MPVRLTMLSHEDRFACGALSLMAARDYRQGSERIAGDRPWAICGSSLPGRLDAWAASSLKSFVKHQALTSRARSNSRTRSPSARTRGCSPAAAKWASRSAAMLSRSSRAADGVLDFTSPQSTVELAALAAQARIVHVIGTTGLSSGCIWRSSRPPRAMRSSCARAI